MRLFITSLFVCIIVAANCQQTAVQWDAAVQKMGDGRYEVSISGTIAKDWYVYGKELKTEGLDPLHLVFEDGNVKPFGSMKLNSEATSFHDPVLSVNTSVYKKKVLLSQVVIIKDTTAAYISVVIKGYAGNGIEFLPIEETVRIVLNEHTSTVNSVLIKNVDLLHPVNNCGDAGTASKGILQLFFLGFIGGIIALLTPCVFPMIPVTVSFFTNRSSTKQQGVRNGILYGLFILLIYISASVPFHLIGNISPEIFNTISTNAWVNVFFFAVFLFFALSFFGLFEIQMPAAFTNAAGNKGSLGSVGGIFFMALTLATVSFSCTGPILGSLLVGSLSSQGGAWQLTSGMGGFGAALALPFALFAMFPQWLKRLPKSGGWMDTVKKILAFIELALAIKFLSNADLVEHWGLLKREVFIGLWVVITLALTVYLFFGGMKMQKSLLYISKWRLALGTLSFLFALYLMLGLTNTSFAPLTLLSGFPPPLNYSLYGKHHAALEHGLEPNVVNDYGKGLELSKQSGKPILIDFTGWACVNCRKMEELVWSDPSVANYIRENFILVSLYVDDRKQLPAAEQMVMMKADGLEKEIATVGDRWALFQSMNFKQVTQPLYVILSKDEKLMNHPVGYTPNVKEYKAWLQCGKEASER